ncbi:MAG: hybrid sensor histidine kinase/response regulator [Prolixibacteraceae bacterium]|nr:hybrid sensor histidine kinase/response regulator [Prolixibacteraceae bacterium]
MNNIFITEPDKSTLLIVDDNMNNIQVLANMLSNNGFNVEFATNGKSALQWMEEETFDLILLDVMMPEMNGFEVCEKIRKTKKYKEIPVIFLTAKTDKESTVKGFNSGGNDYLTKPFDQRELLARVNTQLELKRNRDKLTRVNSWLEQKVAERTKELNLALTEVTHLNNKLLQLDEVKSEFLKMISHEIRTPLNGIIGFTDIIKNSNESEPLMEYIELLEHSAQRLEKFSLNALLFTSLKLGNYVIDSNTANLNDLLKKCEEEVSKKVKEKNLRVQIYCQPNYNLKLDQELISTAVVLILDNAIRFSPDNAEINIITQQDSEKLILTVNDNGVGFSPSALKNLFEFFGSGEQHLDQHVGMGLALAYQIMIAHKGKIEVKNLKEGGASVTLTLPLNISE